MGLADLFRKIFPKPYQRMEGIALSIRPPEAHITYCHRIETAARMKGLTGWVGLTEAGLVKAELEGPYTTLQAFQKDLEQGKIAVGSISESQWLPYKKQYTTITVKFFNATKPPPSKTPPDNPAKKSP